MNTRNILLLGAVAIAIVGALVIGRGDTMRAQNVNPEDHEVILNDNERVAAKTERFPVAKEISTPDGFINVDSINISDHIGKNIVLIDFWTYSCINCQRTLPHLNAWHDQYADQGLVILGIHTPEFQFEEEYENVLDAVKRHNIEYPVILDNDYSTWRAYENNYWPRKYIIDIDGFIVYDHIGEGAYAETEAKIQELLQERAAVLGLAAIDAPNTAPPDATETVVFKNIGTPELYFGASRNEHLGNGTPGVIGNQSFATPESITPNTLYLSGMWNIGAEFTENISTPARIILYYRAKDVYFVGSADDSVRVRVLLDGAPVDSAHAGTDVTEGIVTVNDERLYKLIEGPDYEEHLLELIIDDPGLQAFTFTFG